MQTSSESHRFEITIDEGNRELLLRLNYYLKRENAYGSDTRRFLVEECMMVRNQSNLFLFALDPVRIEYEQHPLWVIYSVSRPARNYHGSVIRFDQLTIRSTQSFEHVYGFVDMISNLQIPTSGENELNLFCWLENSWSYSRIFCPRQLDTIYFHRKNEIVHALDQFLNDTDQQNLYKTLNIPYKFICMFHGLPGTGKSSLIRALASHFGYHICMVKHSQDMDDNSLERMISRRKEKSFLVFEDIDCIFNQREMVGSHSKNNISYSGILNMLDGIGNYNQFVVFITTNHLKNLDSAFKRRVDLFIEFEYVRRNELVEMFGRFFPDAPSGAAAEFWSMIRNKSLTVNMIEKYFLYCLRKKLTPPADLDYLDAYTDMTKESTTPSGLYQ